MSKKEENIQMQWAGATTLLEVLSHLSSRIESAKLHLKRYGEVDDEHWADLYERAVTWLEEASTLSNVLRRELWRTLPNVSNSEQSQGTKRIVFDNGKEHDRLCREAAQKEFDNGLHNVNTDQYSK